MLAEATDREGRAVPAGAIGAIHWRADASIACPAAAGEQFFTGQKDPQESDSSHSWECRPAEPFREFAQRGQGGSQAKGQAIGDGLQPSDPKSENCEERPPKTAAILPQYYPGAGGLATAAETPGQQELSDCDPPKGKRLILESLPAEQLVDRQHPVHQATCQKAKPDPERAKRATSRALLQ